jgi:maleylacetate reductase
MSEHFIYDALPMRVVFGVGSLQQLPSESEKQGLTKVLVLCTPGHRELGETAATLLGDRAVGVFAAARMHVPVKSAGAATRAAREAAADGCVAIGGGSAIGLGKAVALASDLPVIAVPTTYAGSEMTPIWGLTEHSRKRTGRDRKVLPRSVIYDPELTLGLPPMVSAASGINAIAHAVEALYAPDRSPVTSLFAEEGVRSLASALPALVADGDDIGARTAALRGAWLCGACLGATTMGLHHKLCHVFGGTFDLPHAETHAVLLPHVAAYMLARDSAANAALTRALGGEPAAAIAALADHVGVPRTLGELGIREADLETVVEQTVKHFSITADELRAMLLDALHGARRTTPPAEDNRRSHRRSPAGAARSHAGGYR